MLASTQDIEKLLYQIANNHFSGARETVLSICDKNTSQKHQSMCAQISRKIREQPALIELNYKTKQMLYEVDASTFDSDLYFVSDREKELIRRIQTMSATAETMFQAGIKFRNTTLMHGPTGTGKTEFAKYIAKTFGRRLFIVNLAQIIDSYMGHTSKNIQEVFQGVADTGPDGILLLDELDALTTNRKGVNRTDSADRELQRATTVMMQLLDTTLAPTTIVLAATNYVEALDDALKRRFTIHHEFQPLTADERKSMLTQYLTTIKSRGVFSLTWSEKDISTFSEACKDEKNSWVIETLIKSIADAVAAGSDMLAFPQILQKGGK